MAQVTGGRFEQLAVLPFEIDKAAREDGPNGRPRLTIRGWASTEQEDLDGEFIHVGAFDAHLGDFLRNPQMVWMHERGESQGLWTTIRAEAGRGYWVEGYMVHLGTPTDDRRFAMVEEGLVRGLSVGFNGRYTEDFGNWDVVDSSGWPTSDSKWHWTQNCKLLEVSPCNIPCNSGALMELAKGAGMQLSARPQVRAHGTLPFADLPVADEAQPWNEREAHGNVARWACDNAGPKMHEVHLSTYAFVDPDGTPRFQFADVVDGRPCAVWRGVALCMATVLGKRGHLELPEADRRELHAHLSRYYQKFGKEPPEFVASGPVTWRSGEQAILEEARALEDIQRLMQASTSLGNITRHWQREGGAPSAAVTGAAVSAITAATGIVKAAEALSDTHSADLQQAAETLGGVLGHNAHSRAAREETDTKGLTLTVVR